MSSRVGRQLEPHSVTPARIEQTLKTPRPGLGDERRAIVFQERHDARIHHRDHLPSAGLFRQSTCSADAPEAACRLAIEDNGWSGRREDYESSGESHVIGI